MEATSWACRGCDAVGIDAGSAQAHLQDEALEGEHVVDFLDVDGEVVARVGKDGPLEQPVAFGELPAGVEGGPVEADEQPELGPVDVAHLAYIQAVIDELGEDATIVPCPACTGRGFRTDSLRQSPKHERCSTCDGFGRVLTGGSTPNQVEVECPDCQGRGWNHVTTVTPLPGAGSSPAAPAPRPAAPPGFAWTADGSELVRLDG